MYWGYDEEVFGSLPPTSIFKEEGVVDKSCEQVIVHAGNMFTYQNPKNFWRQIKLENDKGNKFKIKFKIKFIGTVDKEVLSYLDEIGLSDSVELLDFFPTLK